MNKLVSLLLKVPSSLLLGCVVALGLMQNDPWLKTRIEHLLVKSVTDLVGEPFHVTVSGIDLLRGKIVIENVSVSSSHGDWAFQCPEVHMDLSWLSWFKGKGFDMGLTMYHPTIFTQYEKGFALEKPFYALVYAPIVLPVNLVSCATDNGMVTIATSLGEISVHCASRTSIEPRMVSTKIRCTDGQVLKESNHTLFANQLTGTMTIEVPRIEEPYSLVLKLSCMRHLGEEKPYQFYYRYKDNLGKITLRAEDGSCAVEADDIIYGVTTKSKLNASGVLGELASLLMDDEQVYSASGTGTFVGEIELTDKGYTYAGDASVADGVYKGVAVSEATVTVEGDEKGLDASIKRVVIAGMFLQGKLTMQFYKGMSGVLSLLQPYEGLPHCTLEKGRAKFDYDGNRLKADIKTRGVFIEGAQVPLKGSITTDFKTAKAQGTFAGNPFTLTGEVAPLKLTSVSLQDPLHMTRVDLKQENGKLQGTIDSALIKRILNAVTGHQLSGEAHAQIKIYDTKEGTRIELKVQDASLKIPGTYTVIKEVSGLLDITSGCVMVKDMLIVFHKGSAWSSCASFYFNEDGSLKGAHVPLQCKGLLISKEKELFGTLSGGLTLSYDGQWSCKGLMIIENAHLRSNLLSSKVQRELTHASSVGTPNINLAIQLQSRTPIKVQTPFLKTDAHLDVSLKGSAANPVIEGTIELAHGTFAFPYKPLFVTNGTLTLSPTQPDGPTINLTAKNKIRTYNVTMRVTGSLHQPNVTFESSPQLSEEGIITLLLAGADHGSLTAAMPRVLMEQIEEVLFGSEESLSRAQQILKSLLAPLKNVRLKKDDTQEELQAVLEVDINERLRAKAQNNLNPSNFDLDETQLELEYVVSDDVSVKAVRDQSGSLGGEIEMRWKF